MSLPKANGHSSKPRNRIDERWLAVLDLGDGPTQGWPKLVAVFDRPFGVPAHGTRQSCEVGWRPAHVHANIGALERSTAHARHADLVLPIVLVGPIVEHDHQHGYLVLGGHPQRA